MLKKLRIKKGTVPFLLFVVCVQARAQNPTRLSVKDVLVMAEDYSPDLRAAEAQEVQAGEEVKAQRSFYYPTLSLEGLESAGFPGSNQQGFIGTAGLMDSPFAKAPVGGLVSRLNLLDLTIPFKVKSARYFLEVARQRTEIVRDQVDWEALGYYFNSMRDRGAERIYADIRDRARALSDIVARLVRTGQHNLADQYLLDVQAQKAAMEAEAYDRRYHASLKELALFIGKNPDEIGTPSYQSFDEKSLDAISSGPVSAFILKAEAEALSARALLNATKAENYPKLLVLGSVGGMAGSRAGIPVNDASIGVGFDLPLFEGFRVQSRVEKARGFDAEKKERVKSLGLYVDETDARYETDILFHSSKIARLGPLLKTADEAFDESRKRYLHYVGPLVDVRDAIRYLSEIENELNDSKTGLWLDVASKAVLDGGKIARF